MRSAELERLLADFDLTRSVTHLLRRAHSRGDDLFAEIMCSGDLTPRQLALLLASYQHPGGTLAELGAAIAVDRSTVAEMVSRMVDGGLLERKASEHDGRAWSIHITEQGIKVLREVMPNNERLMEAVLAPLPYEYRPLFVKCLRLMVGVEQPS